MKRIVYIFFTLLLVLVLYWGSDSVLSAIGKALIVHTLPVPSKAAVVLNTDLEYFSGLPKRPNSTWRAWSKSSSSTATGNPKP